MPIKFKCPDAIEVVSKTTEEQSDLHASTSMASSMRFQVENASKDSKVAASLREMFAQLDKDVPEYLNTDKKVAEYTTIVFTIALKSSYVERDIGRLVALLQEAQLLNLIGVDTPKGTNTFVLDGKTIILVGYSFPRRSRVDKKKLAKLPALLEALTRGLESATIETTPELDTAAVTGADSITLSDEAKEAMENAVKARKEKLSEEEGHKVKANKVPAFKATGAISPALFAALPLGSTAEKADIDASAEASVEAIKALLAASGAAAGGAGASAAPASGGKKGKGGSGAGPQASGGAAGGSAAASAAASDSGDAGFDIDAVAKAAEGLCISEESDKPAADGKKKEAKLTEDEEKQMKKAMQAVLTAFAGKVFASVQTMAAVAEPSSKGKEVEPRELAVRATKVLFNQEQDKIEEGAALSGAASRAATVYFVGKDNIDSLVGITTFNGDEQALIVRMENVTLDSLFRNMPSTEEGKGMMESVMSSLGCGPSRKAAGEIVKEKRGMCW